MTVRACVPPRVRASLVVARTLYKANSSHGPGWPFTHTERVVGRARSLSRSPVCPRPYLLYRAAETGAPGRSASSIHIPGVSSLLPSNNAPIPIPFSPYGRHHSRLRKACAIPSRLPASKLIAKECGLVPIPARTSSVFREEPIATTSSDQDRNVRRLAATWVVFFFLNTHFPYPKLAFLCFYFCRLFRFPRGPGNSLTAGQLAHARRSTPVLTQFEIPTENKQQKQEDTPAVFWWSESVRTVIGDPCIPF